MSAIDTILVVVIILFFVLLVWSRVQQQKMSDTIAEIRDIVKGFKQ
jgi:preprotein translocase subunit YajC